jgi:hypothetical protein
MKENRIKTKYILENHLPSFVREEYPLFVNFLKQYYDSMEYQGAPKDIIENIDEYTKLESLTNKISSTLLTEDVELYTIDIKVESVKGFPKESGLIQIGEEIIYYKNKNSTTNTFEGCVRGFTGRVLNDSGRDNELIFSASFASSHSKDAVVKNLGVQFLKIFLEKTKKLLLPGLDNRELAPDLDQNLFIKQARDFYSTKGTPESFNILFKALFGVEASITTPYDYVIQPSNADYRLDTVITVEVIQGDPSKILNKTLYQDQYGTINKAYGTINNVLKILEDNREYYTLSVDNSLTFDENSIFGNFTVHPATFLITSADIGDDTLDVDSTIGFPESGTLFVKFADNVNVLVDYTSKSTTQFFGCSNITRRLDSETRLSLNTYAYVYGDNEDDLITVRITGILSDFVYSDDVKLMSKDDTIEISSLGYSDANDFRSNDWIFNQSISHKVQELKNLGGFNYELFTYNPINIVTGDTVSVNCIIRDSFGNLENVTRVFDATTGSNPRKSLKITNDVEIVYVYTVTRSLRKAPGLNYNSDVQNTYVDSGKNTYITTPSISRYYNESFELRGRIANFDANLNNEETIPVFNHGFLTGDAIVYFPVDENNTLDIPKAIYFVKKVDNDRIKISKSRSDLFKSDFIKITGIATNNTFAPLDFTQVSSVENEGLVVREIQSQNLIRKLEDPQLTEKTYNTLPGKIGILRNGVEILNYKSIDWIRYGPLTEIRVSAPGQDYDVINPPLVNIADIQHSSEVGFGATAFARVTGSLSRVDVINPGFDYTSTPFLAISGGNGTGALVKANLVAYRHRVEFNAIAQAQRVNLADNIITFSEYHRFRNGERVIYNTQGGVSIGGLVNNASYYVSIIGSRQVKLHRSYEDAMAASLTYNPEVGIVTGAYNEIQFTSFGSGNHILESYERRKRIGGTRVINPGKNYSNRKTIFDVDNVNLYSNTISIFKHGYESGEIIWYESDQPVGGLSSSTLYYVTKIDQNTIRLSEIASDDLGKSYNYDNQIYIDFTSTGNGSFNYEPIKLSISGNIGISSHYFTGVNTSATFNSDIPSFIGIDTSNIKVGHIVNELSGFISSDVKVTSIGIGSIGISTSHLFSSGITTTTLSFSEFIDFEAKIIPVFRGEIHSLVVEKEGNEYGSPDILNYDRQPLVLLTEGVDARAIPIVSEGIIKNVLVQNSGRYYKAQPNIEVIGSGVGAQLSAVIDEQGRLSEIVVITGGYGYDPVSTRIVISTPGVGAKFDSVIKTWNVNLFSRLLNSGQISNDGGVLVKGNNGLQYTNIYAPNNLRRDLYSSRVIGGNLEVYRSDLSNDTSRIKVHSPIIGWAYDGNPIYGPYGYGNPSIGGGIVQMKSGYTLTRLANRPPDFPLGFFVEDYKFTGTGTLDESNGRYCKTPEFPNGTYAYFMTLSTNIADAGIFNGTKFPVFPYLVGNKFRSLPIEFNYNPRSNQKDFDFASSGLIRNTYLYSLNSNNSEYPYFVSSYKIRKQLSDVKATSVGTVDGVDIVSGGQNYQVGDQIIFNDSKSLGGFGAYATVSKVSGKEIEKITSETTILEDVEIIKLTDSPNQYLFISDTPHDFSSDEVISISGINTNAVSFKSSYKITILSNTLQLKVGLNTIASTGIVTAFEVSGRFDEPNLLINDYYQIGDEVVKIIGVDPLNSKITVLRGQNGRDGNHLVNTFLVEKSRKFKISEEFKNYPFNRSKERYFNPQSTLGIGTVGITSTLFLNLISPGVTASVGIGTTTLLYFENIDEIRGFRNGGYVSIASTLIDLVSDRKKIISVGGTSITIDFDTSSVSYSGELCTVSKWNFVSLNSQSMYLPQHGYRTGQKIKYSPNVGTGITVSEDGISEYALDYDQELYVARFNDDVIGLSTSIIGIGSTGGFTGIGTTSINLLYFVGFGTGIYHSFTNIPNDIVKVDINQYLNTVYTAEDHEINIGDTVDVSCIPDVSSEYDIVYDDTNRILVTKRKNFSAIDINIENNTVTIENHGYYNGEKILHTSSSPAGGLENNKIYYVNVLDSDRIRLSSSFLRREDSLVKITSQSFGTISSINPKIDLVRGKILTFNLSDPSLSYAKGFGRASAFTFNIFSDKTFNTRFVSSPKTANFEVVKYGEIGVSTDAKVTIRATENLPTKLYYKLTPVGDIALPLTKQQIVVSDDSNPEHSTILKVNSAFSGTQSIVGVSSTSFSYTTAVRPESDLYVKNDGIINYSTTSLTAHGPISKLKLESKGQRYKRLPYIDTIKTKLGKDAILFPTSDTIGKVLTIRLNGESGYDYPSDITLKPQAKFPQIIKVDPLASFLSIDVVSEGVNYSTAPSVVVKDGFTNKVIRDLTLSYQTGSLKVDIIRNTTGIYDVTPTFIPINNSNGIRILSISYNREANEATLTLEPDYSSIDDFPFGVGTRFLLENITTIDEVGYVNRGYSSSGFEYNLFTVKSADPNIGGANATIVFSLDGFIIPSGETPGIYSSENSLARIIPESYFPVFDAKLQRNNFYIGENVNRLTEESSIELLERIKRSNPNAPEDLLTQIVQRNNLSIRTIFEDPVSGQVEDWDLQNQYIKVSSDDFFQIGDIIKGSSSNSQAVVTNVLNYVGNYKIDSSSLIERGWNRKTGFLNDSLQRIHDNDYYQALSYAVKSNVSIEKWDDAVSTLTHPSGFKKFSDLSVETNANSGISSDQDFGDFSSQVILTEIIDTQSIYDFDLATEEAFNIDGKNISEVINLNSAIIQDYAKSVGNKVLLVDNISDEFNSQPRFEKYSIVNKFRISDLKSRKYVMAVRDKRFTAQKEILLITLFQTSNEIYLNQYGRIDTFGDLGYFDAQIFGEEVSLLFYPNKFEFNDYETSFISFDIASTEESGTLSLGDSIDIVNNYSTISAGVGQTTVFSMPTSNRASKIIIGYRKSGKYEFDEISVVHDGSNVQLLEYGQLSNELSASAFAGVGFGTYYPYISGSNVNIDLILNDTSEEILVDYISINAASSPTGVGSTAINTGTVQSFNTSIGSSTSPTANIVAQYYNYPSGISSEGVGAYLFACVSDTTNSRYEVSELCISSEDLYSSISEFAILQSNSGERLGVFDSESDGTNTYIKFTPAENIDVDVTIFQTSVRIPTTFYDVTSIDI